MGVLAPPPPSVPIPHTPPAAAPRLEPTWEGAGNCSSCLAFSAPHTADDGTQRLRVDRVVRGGPSPARAEATNSYGNFSGIAVPRAGGPYRIRVTLEGFYFLGVVSEPFFVTRGPPTGLRITQAVGGVRGGDPFDRQPRVALTDAGGNVIEEEESLQVEASLHLNPHNGTLFSNISSTALQLARGLAVYAGLTIDKAGWGYQIRYSLSEPARDGVAPFVATPLFRVLVGPLHRLVVGAGPSVERAGEPFTQQPVVRMVDRGGNTLVGNSRNRMRAVISKDARRFGATLSRVETQRVTIRASHPLTGGSFVLGFTPLSNALAGTVDAGGAVNTSAIPFNASAAAVRAALQDLVAVRRVEVARLYPGNTTAHLDISFLTNEGDLPNLAVYLPAAGCSACADPTFAGVGANETGTVAATVSEQTQGCVSPARCLDPISSKPWGISVVVDRGVAYFANLRIDRVADHHQLRFSSDLDPSISVRSDRFRVLYSDPTFLHVERAASEAWAGGQPFLVQPIVGVRDLGFNLIRNTSDGAVVASLLGESGAPEPLYGSLAVDVSGGVATFLNLRTEGPPRAGLTLRFALSGAADIRATHQSLNLRAAAEYLVRPDDDAPGTRCVAPLQGLRLASVLQLTCFRCPPPPVRAAWATRWRWRGTCWSAGLRTRPGRSARCSASQCMVGGAEVGRPSH